MVVLDTSVVLDLIEGDESVLKSLRQFSDQRIGITLFTEYEVRRGQDERNKDKIDRVIGTFGECEFDHNALNEAIKIYKDLEGRGRLINEIDILIAATSISNGEVLLTRDHDFEEIGSPRIRVI
jgi:predicted nucleic acid-binding protein